MASLHFHPLRVRSLHDETDDARVIDFDVPDALAATFQHAPGQYLTLRQALAGEDLRRSYSICTTPGQGLRVAVRRVPGGVFSNWVHTALSPGQVLAVLPPQGRFGAALAAAGPKAGGRHLLFMAGGSGITPILAMLATALATEPSSRCTLIYTNRTLASTMFKEALEDLKNRYLTRLALHSVFSREGVDSPLHSGRLDRAKAADLLRLAGRVDDAFVCGPHAFNDEGEAALLAHGLAPAHIHIERFGVPPEAAPDVDPQPLPGDARAARVTVVRDGVTRTVRLLPEDHNLLSAALRAGLDLPYSCRSGMCATCRAKVVAGRVRMDRNFALEASDLAAGFVLTCQAHALSDEVVLSFDER